MPMEIKMTHLQADTDLHLTLAEDVVRHLGWPEDDNAESWIAVPRGNLVHVLVLRTYALEGRNDNCRAGQAGYGESTRKSFLQMLKNLRGGHGLERLTLLMLREDDPHEADKLLSKLMPLAVRKNFGLTSLWDTASVDAIVDSMKSRVAGGAK